jgi:hypothetical protein
MSEEHRDDEIDVDAPGSGDVFLRCGDGSFDRLVESIKLQPGVMGDLGDPTAIHVEKKSAYNAVLRESTWFDRLALFGCGLVALVVIVGVVNGVMTIANFFRSF